MNNETPKALKIIRAYHNTYRKKNNIDIVNKDLNLDYEYIENQLDEVYRKDENGNFIYFTKEARINKLFEYALSFFKSESDEFYSEKEQIIAILIEAISQYDQNIISY
ncbi:hypothetical protein R4J00_08070 [Brachyspira intermedia]|uniref:hypothetical protein n=1 Tax=Brachyspira intermedia TaxID=84377 RepID=UPI0030076A2B